MPLPEFNNEAEFRQTWVGPFLTKLGFILPKSIHGADEQGKDFYFADYDRFGHLRFYAAQAKLGDIGTGREVTELMDQVERCFEVPLRHHKGAHEQRISAVYIMTTGTISHQARERISDRCRARSYGENVYYLDGATLDNLERHAAYQDDKAVRQRLIALLNEATYNLGPIQQLQQTSLQGKPLFRQCRTLAIEEALKNPLPDPTVPYSGLSSVWQLMEEINKRVVPYNLSFKDEAVASFARIAEQAFNHTVKLRDACSRAIKTLDERYSLELEVVKRDTE